MHKHKLFPELIFYSLFFSFAKLFSSYGFLFNSLTKVGGSLIIKVPRREFLCFCSQGQDVFILELTFSPLGPFELNEDIKLISSADANKWRAPGYSKSDPLQFSGIFSRLHPS